MDVFEKGEVGGRLATVTVNQYDYESGGSIIHSLNLHMQEFVKQLGWYQDDIKCTVKCAVKDTLASNI